MNRYEDYGPTLLRVTLGVMWLVHSAYLKLFIFTVPGTVAFFQTLGLPGFSAYAVIVTEIVGGILLIAGVRVRATSAVLAVVAFGATWAHADAGWLFTNEGGGWEYPLFLAMTSLVQVLLGPGALRLTIPTWHKLARVPQTS